ncbi:uncharacterized protein [Phyllobates terribilis]|uniref:uncharacterized protein n=1 Tax=Phyllobates terribilis TaxID=111132 RepID=UPI003CCB6F73
MGLKGKYSVLFFVVALFLLSCLTAAKEDPELMTCKHQCRQQRQYDEKQKRFCERQCEDYSKEKRERERRKEGKEEDERWDINPRWDPQEDRREMGRRSRGYDEEGEGERENPYVFNEDEFETKFQNQFGRERVLPKFSRVSKHLKGIENFRVEIFETKPMTFMLPKHCDADAFFFVANGRGTITLVSPDNRESFNIQRGHIMKVAAGTNVYLVNSDDNERLILVKLIQPVSNPGKFESFFGAGGRNPESFFNALSPEIVEALFNVRRDRLEKFFRKQDQGIVKKASREQIRALSQKSEEGAWPFGGAGARTSNGPFNLFRQRPLHNNEFGKLIEVDSDDFKQLRDLNLRITFANITQGGMHTLHYNTRATKIAVVVKGTGHFQMACPHIAGEQRQRPSRHQEEEASSVHYEKVSAKLSCGTVFIVPAGHPFVTVASRDENLEVICFEVNAEDNEKVALAGNKSVFKQLEREAKELSFEDKAEVVDEFLGKQKEEFFFAGPRSRQQRGGRSEE